MPENTAPASKRIKLDFSETVTTVVGLPSKEYILHRNVAIKTSHFMRAAMNGCWRETQDMKIMMPNVDARQFEVYAQWLYSGNIVLEVKEELVKANDKLEIAITKYTQLMDLYLLAHYLLDSAFRNALIDAVIDTNVQIKHFPGVDSILQIWPSTPAMRPMKRLITRFWAKDIRAEQISDVLPQDFAVGLIREILNAKETKTSLESPTKKARCDYHEHDELSPNCA